MALLTEEVVKEAIKLALPTIQEILKEHTWGPKGVFILVQYKEWGLTNRPYFHTMDELGPDTEWETRWGEGLNFRLIAREKLRVSLREGRPSREVVTNSPWALEKGDSLYGGAYAEEDKSLAVAVSGSYQEVDEAIARIVWNIIWMLCTRRIAELRKAGINDCP